MPRLLRPHIPLEVRCRVVLRQLGEMFVDQAIENRRPRRDAGYMVGVVGLPGGGFGAYLDELLDRLAELLACDVKSLALDHDPALGARRKVFRKGVHVGYVPDANDPEHLIYRPHGAHFEGSHDVKTRIRGEHGQFSDIALIKRDRRRERKKNPTAHQIKMADLREEQRRLRREFRAKMKRKAGKGKKTNWPSRPFRSKKSLERFGGTDA